MRPAEKYLSKDVLCEPAERLVVDMLVDTACGRPTGDRNGRAALARGW
jgi:hypothetical protein